jgi:6-phosphogluconate dehydrogenase (decarboxylating)
VALSAAGVSIWLDDLSRNRLQTGIPQELIDDGNLVLTTSHYERFHPRRLGEFTDKIRSATRNQFGSHAEKSRT